jgi:hypothetical protein
LHGLVGDEEAVQAERQQQGSVEKSCALLGRSMCLGVGTDPADQPGVFFGVVEPVQDAHPRLLHGEPCRKPLRVRRIRCWPERLLGQIALGQCLLVAVGSCFRLAAPHVQVSLLQLTAGHRQGLSVGIDGRIELAQPPEDSP